MYGVSRENPECIHAVDEAVEYINKVGFLPLFKNEIPGFSLEEHTAPEYWWSGDPKSDPWEWREIIARSGKVAYGKFFDRKRVLFQSSGFRILQTSGGTDMILMRFGMMKRRPSGKRKSWISIWKKMPKQNIFPVS